MLINLLAAGAQGAPQNKFGFAEALQQGGFIAYATVTILGIMSFGSFYILFTKWFEQSKILRQFGAVRSTFWKAPTLREGSTKLEKNSAWRQLVEDGLAAEEQHAKMTDALEAHDWMHSSLARSEASINARLASGLPFLATVGATSPFVGLFGTVVGIYRALVKIGAAGQAAIGDVAGPVGEALIMTAIGLVVAVPAVLAYNWLQSRNKSIQKDLSSFSNDVLGYLASNGAVRPSVAARGPAPVAKPAVGSTTAGQAGGVPTAPRV